MSAPLGPRLLPRVMHDEEGRYTVYVGLICQAPGCGLDLTSRNRYGKRHLCIEHGRAAECERKRKRYAAGAATRAAAAAVVAKREACPRRKGLRTMLGAWLNHPTEERLYVSLMSQLRDYELVHRLRQVLPQGPPQAAQATPQDAPAFLTASTSPDDRLSIPVEEPIFPNPEHRTTHLEFLADCSTYGV